MSTDMQEFRPSDDHRMTDEEAQLVMRILSERRQQREELQAMPTVKDVAQMANVDPDDVASALAELRARQVVPVTVYEAPRARSGFPTLAVVAVTLLLVFLLGAFMLVGVSAPPEASATPYETVTVSADAPLPTPVQFPPDAAVVAGAPAPPPLPARGN